MGLSLLGAPLKRLKKEEFTKQFRKAHTDLERIKLAIREDRYTIWTRKDKPTLPDTYKTTRHKRKSGEQGLEYVVELKYTYNGTGRRIPIYLKGFFSKDGHLIIGFEIQSLRRDE